MRKRKRSINNLNMLGKMVACFSAVLLIPVGICIYLNVALNHAVEKNTRSDVMASIERTVTRVSQMLDSAGSVSSSILGSRTLLDALTATYPTEYDMVNALWQKGDIAPFRLPYEDDILEIHLYLEQIEILNTGYIQTAPDSVRGTDWYQSSITGDMPLFWTYLDCMDYSNFGKKALCLTRTVSDNSWNIGVLNIYVSPRMLDTILKQEQQEVLLFAPDGTVVAATDSGYVGKGKAEFGISDFSDGEQTIRYGETDTAVLNRVFTLEKTGDSFCITTVMAENQLGEETTAIGVLTVVITAVGALICFLMIFLVSKMLTARLKSVSGDLHRASSGDFNFVSAVDGQDEIGTLSQDLNIMLRNTQKLIDEVYEANLQKQRLEYEQKEIQLQVLNHQLNPHFLFNALEGVRMKAVVREEPDIAELIQMISTLLRSSLYMGNAPIPLSEELELVDKYMKIQGMKFDAKLQYRISVLCDIGGQTILPFTIQPIVENAVRHGLENVDCEIQPRFVSVSVMKEETDLLLYVVDNGAGISPAALEQINRELSREENYAESAHIGIQNVQKRLKLFYGPEYGLSISSVPNNGTVVTIRIPAQ